MFCKMNYQKLFGILLFLGAMFAAAAQGQKATYTNPVQAGDFPDPSVIRGGKVYYAPATSSDGRISYPASGIWLIGTCLRVFPKDPNGGRQLLRRTSVRKTVNLYFVVARKKTDRFASRLRPPPNRPDLTPTTARWNARKSVLLTLSRFVMKRENCLSFGRKTATALTNQRRFGRRNLTKDAGNSSASVGKLCETTPIPGKEISWKVVYYAAQRMVYMFLFGNACCGRGCNYAMGCAFQNSSGQMGKIRANPILKGNENLEIVPDTAQLVTDEKGKNLDDGITLSSGGHELCRRQALLDEVNWTADGWAKSTTGKGASRQPTRRSALRKRGGISLFDDFTRRIAFRLAVAAE